MTAVERSGMIAAKRPWSGLVALMTAAASNQRHHVALHRGGRQGFATRGRKSAARGSTILDVVFDVANHVRQDRMVTVVVTLI
jgi:nitrogen fixation protein FixH